MVKLVTLVIIFTVIPTIVISYVAISHEKDLGSYALESNLVLGESATNDSAQALQTLGEQIIEQKAKDVAKQVEIYLADRPSMTVNDILNDTTLGNISVQDVGQTGYTAIVDASNFIILTHRHPSYVGMDLTALEYSLPSFWAVIEPSAGGNTSLGYYDWEEPDGSIRQKYAYISPINVTTADGNGGLTLWATTYIDEFSSPVMITISNIANATSDTNQQINLRTTELLNQLVMIIGILVVVVVICAVAFTRTITTPVSKLKAVTEDINKGNLDFEVSIDSNDEIGDLATSFDAMRLSLKDSYETLEQKVRDRTEQIRESERRLADIINFLPDPTFVIDSEGKVIAWNKAMEELTSLKSKDILGKGDYEYALPFYGERRPMIVNLAMEPDRVIELKYEKVERHGDTLFAETFAPKLQEEGRYVWAAASSLHNSKGAIVGSIEIIRDITDRKHVEQALMSEKDVAEASTRAKSEFLANMSHEIRTPMNGIIGMIDLTLDTELNDEQREYLDLAKSSAQSLLILINDILDFSKIEAKKLDIEFKDFDLYDMMDQTMRVLGIDADNKGVELVYEIDHRIDYTLKGDSFRLKQVLMNLVKNAVKFTDEGHIYVKVREAEGVDDRKKLHFSVEDTGIGIAKEKLQVIFDTFTQVDGSTTRRFGGTGLGLTITKRLVEMMNGEIWVESEEGKGSVFHVVIPFEAGEPIELYPVSSEDLKGLSVLIADDNAMNRLILRRNLESWGMEVTEASCGAECIENIDKALKSMRTYQILLLDCMMPGIDGFEVAERLRDKGMEDIIIIMLSSLDQQGDKERSRELGISEYLVKPVSPSALMNAIMNVLSSKGRKASKTKRVRVDRAQTAVQVPEDARVLIAEDNAVNRKLAVRLLEKVGIIPVTTENGLQVMEALEKDGFDIILMDIQMPEMDGLEATEKIRAKEAKDGGHIPIIALTAHAMKGDRERFLEAGLDDYLPKPLDPDQMYRIIAKYVATAEVEPEQTASESQYIDVKDLKKRLGDDDELISEMFGIFIEDTQNLLMAIQSAVEGGDAEALQHSAHSLKGMAANLSAVKIREAAFKLEQRGSEDDFSDIETLLTELKESINKTIEYLFSTFGIDGG
ncbi:MAG: hypothetical protein AYK23_02700 [Candidatus Proteinoplasmatales archaeon SG8-5]|nr:MAG: hypothetical protein AYK23_02700 [Candidatus Proteinoplasmatales archaeon SG8-5]